MAQKSADQKREEAALLVAEDRLTDEQIAQTVGIGRRTLARLKNDSDFQDRVAAIVQEFADRIVAEGIANKQNRINALVDRHRRMERVIEDRADDDILARAPGGSTGLLVVTYKGKDADREEFVVDTGLLAEMRATEKQTAQELGEWTEKSDVTSGGKSLAESLADLMATPIRVEIAGSNPFEGEADAST